MPEPTSGVELKRAIRLNHATALVVGIIIGASIFVQPSEITGQVPTVGGIFAVWAVAGILSLFGALVCAELASTFPAAGGVYVYLREAYSPMLGFLFGWAMFWTMHSGIIAAIAVVFARYVGFFVPLGEFGSRAVAVSAVLLISWVNYRGVRQGSVLQTWFTWTKVLAIVAIIAVGFAMGGDAHEAVVAAAQASPTPAGTGAGTSLSEPCNLLHLVTGPGRHFGVPDNDPEGGADANPLPRRRPSPLEPERPSVGCNGVVDSRGIRSEDLLSLIGNPVDLLVRARTVQGLAQGSCKGNTKAGAGAKSAPTGQIVHTLDLGHSLRL